MAARLLSLVLVLASLSLAGCDDAPPGILALEVIYPDAEREGSVLVLGDEAAVLQVGDGPWDRLVHLTLNASLTMADAQADQASEDEQVLSLPPTPVRVRLRAAERLQGYEAEWEPSIDPARPTASVRRDARETFSFNLTSPETTYVSIRLYREGQPVAYVSSPPGVFPTAVWDIEGAIQPLQLENPGLPAGLPGRPSVDRFILPGGQIPTMAAATRLQAAPDALDGTDVDLALYDAQGLRLACSRRTVGSSPAAADADEALNHSTFDVFAPVPWVLTVGSLSEACDGDDPSYSNPGPVRYHLRVAYIGR